MGEGDPHTFINRRATIVDTYRLSPRYHYYSMSLPSFKTNKRHIGYRTFHTCTKVHPPFPVDVRGANEIINISKSDRFFFAVYDWHWTSKTGGIAVQCKTCTFVEVHESFLVYYSVYLKWNAPEVWKQYLISRSEIASAWLQYLLTRNPLRYIVFVVSTKLQFIAKCISRNSL